MFSSCLIVCSGPASPAGAAVAGAYRRPCHIAEKFGNNLCNVHYAQIVSRSDSFIIQSDKEGVNILLPVFISQFSGFLPKMLKSERIMVYNKKKSSDFFGVI